MDVLIEITVSEVVADSLILVKASKDHQIEPDLPASITSEIALNQLVAILARPDPAPALRLWLNSTQSGDALQVSDGEPGVFYYLRSTPTGEEFKQAVYFHKRDAQNATQNKGLGQLGLEVDFVVVGDSTPGTSVTGAAASTFPPLPTLDITPLTIGSEFYLRAVKAQTAVETLLDTSRLVEEKVVPDA